MSNTTAAHRVPWTVSRTKRIALIDADGVLYSAALRGVTKCDGAQLQILEDDEILEDCLGRMNEVASWCGEVGEVFVCLTSNKNFRKGILPSYKGQRKTSERPITLDALREAVLDRRLPGFTPMLVETLEADDVCGIAATTFQKRGYQTVVVSPDKDMLQIPGFTLTPQVRKGSRAYSEVTEERAFRWHMYQTLVGDQCDNYKGCPGVGPAKADALLDYCELQGWNPSRVWGEVVDQFLQKGLTEAEALVQARVSRILRCGDWDVKRKEVILWQPPRD